MNIVRLAIIGLPVATGMACSLASPVAVAPGQASTPPPRPERSIGPPRPPGFTVPGSQVGVPSHARAGSMIEGRAPAGSRVEAAGQVLKVGADMRFRLQIPADARGALPVRIIRPDGRVLVLRVIVSGD